MNTRPPIDLDPSAEPMTEPPAAGEGLPLRTIGAIAGAVLVVVGAGTWMFLRRHSSSAGSSAAVAAAPAAQSPSRSATSQWFAPHTSAPAPAVADAQPKSAAQAALARAQGQIESGKAKAAEKTLASVLRRKKLPRSDRATALRLMGMAEARRGHRKAAIAWYKKSLKATEDPTDRDRIAQHIRQLTKARKTADVIAAADTP